MQSIPTKHSDEEHISENNIVYKTEKKKTIYKILLNMYKGSIKVSLHELVYS